MHINISYLCTRILYLCVWNMSFNSVVQFEDWRGLKVSSVIDKARNIIALLCKVDIQDIEILGVIDYKEIDVKVAEEYEEYFRMTFVFYSRRTGIEGANLYWSYDKGEFCQAECAECGYYEHPTGLHLRSGGWRDLTCHDLLLQITIYLADVLDVAPKHVTIKGLVHRKEGEFVYDSFRSDISQIVVYYNNDLAPGDVTQSITLEWSYDDNEFWSHYPINQ